MMIPKMDPKQMAKLMNQMGIKTTEVDAARVIVEKTDGSRIVVTNPSVQVIDMQGQKSLQVGGEFEDVAPGAEKASGATDSSTGGEQGDVEIVMAEAGCSREEAEKALTESGGDLAQALLKLGKG